MTSLAPPRPFFFAESSRDHRSSWSDSTSVDPPSESPSDSDREQPPPPPHPPRPRHVVHALRRSDSPDSSYHELRTSLPRSLSRMSHGSRPPPSSFPFQAYPGNPDPLPPMSRRRSSLESLPSGPVDTPVSINHSGSLTDLRRPLAPFMHPSSDVYRNSAAASMSSSLLRSPSSQNFRAPFLSPTSRPNSSLWSPPAFNQQFVTPYSPSASSAALPYPAKKSRTPLPSTRLNAPLDREDKPWLTERDSRARISWWATFFCMVLGIGAAAVLCWQGVSSVMKLEDSRLCMVLNENFDGTDLDTTVWTRDVDLGGFGNGEFEMTTSSPNNLYLSNSELYIHPTLTSDVISRDDILNGGTYTLQDCTAVNNPAIVPDTPPPTNTTVNGGNGTATNGTTTGNGTTTAGGNNPNRTPATNGGHNRRAPSPGPGTNQSACTAVSDSSRGTVINPVQSARISTKGKKSIRYGKVEVRAKLPRGDWLWPAIWMLPENNTYGPWPASGEIDLLEARGNGPGYPAQGNNFVRSTLSYGPMPGVEKRLFGWFSFKRTTLADTFHTYTLEWDEKFMRFSTDSRLHAMLDLRTVGKKEGFWERAGFPLTAQNGSAQVVVQNPYEGRPKSAPFDQSFYLIVNLAAGGTSGWFPDGEGDKPWFDGSLTAMRDFARAQDTWSATWPESPEDRSFRIDYVKMWEVCR